MKRLIFTICGMLLFAGCASQKGGTSDDDYYKGYGTRSGTGNPIGNNSPASATSRPGLNPDDVRDPSGLAVPWRVPSS